MNGAKHSEEYVSLKEYFEKDVEYLKEILANNKELIESKFAQNQLAINKAEEAQKLKNEASNEWREAMKDREKVFANKTEIQSLEDKLGRNTDDIIILRESEKFLAGKASQGSVYLAISLALLAVAIEAINLLR